MNRQNLWLEFPQGGEDIEFTGERYVPGVLGQLQYEHHHRYLAAVPHLVGKRVLDVACGEGYGSFALAQVAHSLCGVDVATEVVTRARKHYQRHNLEFRTGSITAIPCPDADFDVIVCFETIEHVEEQSAAVVELRRVLKPSGLLIISSPNASAADGAWHGQNPFHKKELTFEEFRDLLSPHFAHVRFAEQRFLYGSMLTEMGALSDNEERAAYCSTDGGATYTGHRGDLKQSYFVAMASATPPPSLGLTILDAEKDLKALESQLRDAVHYGRQLQNNLEVKERLLTQREIELADTRSALQKMKSWRQLAEIQLAHLRHRCSRDD